MAARRRRGCGVRGTATGESDGGPLMSCRGWHVGSTARAGANAHSSLDKTNTPLS
jgi:hypothetical protein